MSYLRFILIKTLVDKCQQKEAIADQQRQTAVRFKITLNELLLYCLFILLSPDSVRR